MHKPPHNSLFVVVLPSPEQCLRGIRRGFLSSPNMVACSRLRDSGESEKSFKNKKTRGGWGETGRPFSHFSRRHRPLCQVARVLFSLCSFNTSPLYYLRAWHRLSTWIHLILVRKSPQTFGRLYLTKTVVGKSASISRYWFCVPD